jgi:hypothetical protein
MGYRLYLGVEDTEKVSRLASEEKRPALVELRE